MHTLRRGPEVFLAEGPDYLLWAIVDGLVDGYFPVFDRLGDEMRVTIDGKPAGYLKSSGIAHPTKSKIELGVAGKDGYFDDIKVWSAEPAKR